MNSRYFTVSTISIQSVMIGALLADSIRSALYYSLDKPASKLAFTASILLVIGLITESHSQVLPPGDKFAPLYLTIYASLDMVAIFCIIAIHYIRLLCIKHVVSREFKVVGICLASFLVTDYVVCRVCLTIDDVSMYLQSTRFLDVNIRNALRASVPLISCLYIFFFEFLVTESLYSIICQSRHPGSGTEYGKHASLRSAFLLSRIYTACICTFFMMTVGLRIMSLYYPEFVYVPFYTLGWSLALKRIYEFKEDYVDLMTGDMSDSVTPSPVSVKNISV